MQLVFEHALRIRMKAETHSNASTTSTPAESTSTTPRAGTLSNADHSAEASSDTETTLHSPSSSEAEADTGETRVEGSSTTVKSTDDSQKDKAAAAPVDPEGKNLVGKINNLVTSDLSNIMGARNFLRLIVYTPVSLVFCIVFLYAILGWSALVGLAVILLSFPLPGFLTKIGQDVMGATFTKTDGRVQVVTEGKATVVFS